MALDRGRLRRSEGVRFAKLLGTATQFAPTRPDPTRWAALVVSDRDVDGSLLPWRALASAYCRLDLRVEAVRGSWAGQRPFPPPEHRQDDPPGPRPSGPPAASPDHGLVLALTRARLRPTRAVSFWRASAGLAPAVSPAPGLLTAFGIGEAPVGWPGTVSLWRSPRDLIEFAYRHPGHRRVIDRTRADGWYAEELFIRFAVLDIVGDRRVLGWPAAESAAEEEAS
jgi:hypothetical protein